MQKRGIWFFVVTVVLLGLSAFINYSEDPNLGLDVAGGVRFTIRAEIGNLSAEERTGEAWARKANQTVQILERRAAQSLGVSEANVYRKGNDKFIVELPGVSNEAEARAILTASARLQYFWPRNVATDRDISRPYVVEYIDERDETGATINVEKFRRRTTTDTEYIEPKSEEWQRMLERWELITTGDMLVSADARPGPNNRNY